MFVAIMLVLVAVGTVVFHVWSPWWWTPIASNWGGMDDTIVLTFWIAGVTFIAVVLFTAYCVYRFRYQEGRRADYEPENSKLEGWLTALTAIGVAGLLAPGLFIWNQYITVPEDAHEVEVLGQQWRWTYRFPGADGVFGLTSPKNINDDNPFGIDPNDPNGQDDILIEEDEVHIPLDKSVKFLLRSIDVLHNFYVPQFRAKMDLVPGLVTYYWITPTRTGTFDVMCLELCGVNHHAMRGTVVVEEDGAYEAWLKEQPTFAQSIAEARSGTEDGPQKNLKLVLGETAADSTADSTVR